MDGGPQRERRSDDRGRRALCRPRCMGRSVERYVNASLARSGLAEPTTSSAVRT